MGLDHQVGHQNGAVQQTVIKPGAGFPGGPVVRMPYFQCQRRGSIPDGAFKIPQAAWHGQKWRWGTKRVSIKERKGERDTKKKIFIS